MTHCPGHFKHGALLLGVFIVAAICCAPARADASLGRLFFTKAQRSRLEYQLQLRTAPFGDGELAVHGMVWRSGGRSTLWASGATLYQKTAPLQLVRDPTDPSRVALRLADRPPLWLRVGAATR